MRRAAAPLLLVALMACDSESPAPSRDPSPSSTSAEPNEPAEPSEPAEPASPDPQPLTAAADYLVTVVTPDWNASSGTLSRFRRDERGAWALDADDIAVVLGRSGVAWARGIHGDAAPEGRDGPVKREGDGRSPAGAFWLDRALGYAPAAPEGTRIPYQPMTRTLQCIEDEGSEHYNRIVDRAVTTPDWNSTDLLRRDDGLYELLLFVAQNTEPAPVPGRGSCVLFHVWSSPEATTAGCTAMPKGALEDVIRRLAPESNMLVQLPAPAYDALAEPWGLPSR